MARLFQPGDRDRPTSREEKQQKAQQLIRIYAGLAVANSLNPIPGLDVGVDAGILAALHHSITTLYGFPNEPGVTGITPPQPKDCFFAVLQSITRRLAPSWTGKAAGAILRQLGMESVGRETTKWFPVVGTAISATIGYQIVYRFGEKLLAECEAATTERPETETPAIEQLPQAA